MSREFLPGNCQSIENRETFLQIDGGEVSQTAFEIAKTICQTCVQREFCADQRDGIAIEMAKRGMESDTTIIGGIEVAMQDARTTLADQSALERLREPAFHFDIQHLPDEFTPRQILDSIRQAMRARQIRVEGRPPNHKETMEAHLQSESAILELDAATSQETVEAGAAIILRFRAFGLTQHRKAKPLTESELEEASAIFGEFAHDALALAALGAKPRFAQYHEPALYSQLIEVTSKNNLVTPATARDIVRQYASDPVTALKRRVDASAIVSNTHLQIPRELNRYRREISQRSTSSKDDLKKLRKTFNQLVGIHPDAGRETLAYIAYHYPNNAVDVAQEYQVIYQHYAEYYSKHPFLTPHIVSSIILKHLSNAPVALQNHIERATQMQQNAAEAGLEVDATFLGYAALATERVLDAPELRQRYLARRVTHKSSTRHPLLTKPFAVMSADRIIDNDERERALTCASNLVRRGLMHIKGTMLEWTDKADYLYSTEKDAVLHVTSLDTFHDTPPDPVKLAASLKSDNLDALVNQILVPYLLPPTNTNDHVLDYLRYRQYNGLANYRTAKASKRAEMLRQHLGSEVDITRRCESIFKQIADAYPHHWPTKENLREAIKQYQADFSRIDVNAIRESTSHIQALVDYTGSISPRITKKLFVYAVRNGNPPLRNLRKMLGRLDELSSMEGASKLNNSCFTALLKLDKPEQEEKIATIKRLVDQHKTNIWLTQSLINKIAVESVDPDKKLAFIVRNARDLHARFHEHLERSDAIFIATTSKDPDAAAAKIVTTMDDLAIRHAGDPTLHRLVLLLAARDQAPDDWLAAYRDRYNLALSLAAHDATVDSIKRIAALNWSTKALRKSIKTYTEICEEYRYDDYIERWMIDDALRWTSSKFVADLRKLRYLLWRGLKTVSYTTSGEADEARVVAIERSTAHQSSEDTYHNNETKKEQRAALVRLLSQLSSHERAAVVHVYDVDLDEVSAPDPEELYLEFGVTSLKELTTIVNTIILPKIVET